MQFTDREKALLKEYLQSFAVERELFLVLHQRVCAEHPEWVTNGDARSNILAKPVNLILTALANLHLLENVGSDTNKS